MLFFPSAVTYVDASGNRNTFISLTASDAVSQFDLLLNYWNGFSWNWQSVGVPAGTSWVYGNSSFINGSSPPWTGGGESEPPEISGKWQTEGLRFL
ncbi:MAG TPA: hypothetical protein VKY85_05435 [Candidatus Angelobacter sp.]|nr:hypothetical protein [Candidatus Angelobacter sp.]